MSQSGDPRTSRRRGYFKSMSSSDNRLYHRWKLNTIYCIEGESREVCSPCPKIVISSLKYLLLLHVTQVSEAKLPNRSMNAGCPSLPCSIMISRTAMMIPADLFCVVWPGSRSAESAASRPDDRNRDLLSLFLSFYKSLS